MATWNLEQAVELVRKIEDVAPLAGCHVALTGGCLYKDGERKDLDILFYRIRQAPEVNIDILCLQLLQLGLSEIKGSGWIYKAKFNGKDIDMFFPEEIGNEEYKKADKDDMPLFFG